MNRPMQQSMVLEAEPIGSLHNPNPRIIIDHSGEGGPVLDATAALARLDALPPDRCEQDERQCRYCETPFKPRSKSGGRPQLYCSVECRMAFHAEHTNDTTGVSQHRKLHVGVTPDTNTMADEEREEPLQGHDSGYEPWDDEDTFKLPEQGLVAVYPNNHGQIIIREKAGPFDEEDSCVFIHRNNLLALIDKLCEFAGIGSAP